MDDPGEWRMGNGSSIYRYRIIDDHFLKLSIHSYPSLGTLQHNLSPPTARSHISVVENENENENEKRI